MIKRYSCVICGDSCNRLKGLSNHVNKTHKLTLQQYYDTYFKQNPNEGYCIVCGKPTTFISFNEGYRKTCSPQCGNKTEESKQKRKNTMIDNYGVSCSFRLPGVEEKSRKSHKTKNYRKLVSDIQKTTEVKNKIKKTKLERYGDENYNNPEKVKQTSLERYGVDHYNKSEKARKTSSIKQKSRKVQQKRELTCLKRFGVKNQMQSAVIQNKRQETLRKNCTFNSSKPEEFLYKLLLEKFNENDVIRGFKSDLYPYCCDFYIKSLDLYIELNNFWMHNGHWFDENDKNDIELLQKWKEKPSKAYKQAIKTWTYYDVNKRNTAKLNDLYYIVLWTLKDIDDWVKSNFERRKDY